MDLSFFLQERQIGPVVIWFIFLGVSYNLSKFSVVGPYLCSLMVNTPVILRLNEALLGSASDEFGVS